MDDSQFYPAVLFGPKPGQLVKLKGQEFIKQDDGIYYPVDLLASKTKLFEGRPVCERHRNFPNPNPLEIGRVIHVIWNGKRREVQGIVEIRNPTWQRHLEALQFRDDLPGLSPVFHNVRRGPPGARLVENILAIVSVDISQNPLSGARFLPPADGVEIMVQKEAERIQRIQEPVGFFSGPSGKLVRVRE